jgi:hypothetical protein
MEFKKLALWISRDAKALRTLSWTVYMHCEDKERLTL